MNTYFFNIPTEKSFNYFKKGSWYRGLGTEEGIVAKFEDTHSNDGWWGSSKEIEVKLNSQKLGTFCKSFFRLVTPELWEEIDNANYVSKLDSLLLNAC
jgi:hypothetical protein